MSREIQHAIKQMRDHGCVVKLDTVEGPYVISIETDGWKNDNRRHQKIVGEIYLHDRRVGMLKSRTPIDSLEVYQWLGKHDWELVKEPEAVL